MQMPNNQTGASAPNSEKPKQEVGQIEFRSYVPGDEKGITAILSACHANGWGNEELWRWKHSKRPNFVSDDVTIAYVNRQMAGCFHHAVLSLRLEDGLEIPMCFEGDFAVLLEFRKLGIPLQAHDLADRRLLAAGVILRGGFTSRELNERFYHKQFGYIFAPTVTTEFRKILGLPPLQAKVRRAGERLVAVQRIRKALAIYPLLIDLVINRFPDCHLEVTDHGLELRQGFAGVPHLRLTLPYQVLVSYQIGYVSLLKEVLLNGMKGRIRVRGLLANAARWLGLFMRCLRP